MKIVVKVKDVVALAKRFETSPGEAMREVVGQFRDAMGAALEQVMEAEVAVFLGREAEAGNKRNGYTTRSYAIKGVGAISLRVPRDRAGRFESRVLAKGRRYDPALEKDLALLHLSGLSTRALAHVSKRVLGVNVSPAEVSNALGTIIPAARAFLERPLTDRRFRFLYVDGTNFRVRRNTVAREPTLVVIGIDEDQCKSVIAMVQGDKDSRGAWEMVFASLKERGLEPSAVQLGIMDGLVGLGDAFLEAFPKAEVARCWVHKARNVFPRVPVRYQTEFKTGWDAIAYAANGATAREAFAALKLRWAKSCPDALQSLERDIEALLVHYTFPPELWDALRTTNPIERVNKEFKRRSKAMETIGPDGLKALLAFTALRLEYGWSMTPVTSGKLLNLPPNRKAEDRLSFITRDLLN